MGYRGTCRPGCTTGVSQTARRASRCQRPGVPLLKSLIDQLQVVVESRTGVYRQRNAGGVAVKSVSPVQPAGAAKPVHLLNGTGPMGSEPGR